MSGLGVLLSLVGLCLLSFLCMVIEMLAATWKRELPGRVEDGER